MQLPDVLNFRETLHGHGDKGMYVYRYADTSGAGVTVEVRRATFRAAETKQWRHVALPEQYFDTLDALRAALEPLTDDAVAAEAMKWPQAAVEPEHDGSPNRCRLCPREPQVPAKHRATVRTSWSEIEQYAGLCDEHAKLASDPTSLLAALRAEVAERRARAKSLSPRVAA